MPSSARIVTVWAAAVFLTAGPFAWAQDSKRGGPPLDQDSRDALAEVAQRFWESRPKTAFEEWDPTERAAIFASARKIALGEGQLVEALAILWRPASRLGPKAAGGAKKTIATPDGEAWFQVKGSGRGRGLVLGLHGGGEGAGSASEAAGVWTAKDCIAFYPQAIKLVDDAWNTTYGERFLLTLIEVAKAEYQIDPDRVYVMGFSMGGTGAWFLAGRHPDLLAGAAPCAGVFMAQPRSQLATKAEVVAIQHGLLPNVRNLAMHYFIGLLDRNCMPGTYLFAEEELSELRKADPDGYRGIHFQAYPKVGHAFPPGEPKRAIGFLEKQRRDSFPSKVVWEHAVNPFPLPRPDDRSTRLQKRHFYWLRCDAPKDRQVIRASRSGNEFEIDAEGTRDGLAGISLLLNGAMIDPSKDVVVRSGATTVYTGRPPPDLACVLDTLDARLDTTLVFDRRIDF